VLTGILQSIFCQQLGDAFSIPECIYGGGFENFSIFALSITPYITASIIVQLLTIAIPKLEELQRDGEDGRKKAEHNHQIPDGWPLALFESSPCASDSATS
jgi:preprotein translocase subunit SecY